MDRTFDPRVDSFVFAKHLIIFAIEYHEKNQINAAIKSEVKTWWVSAKWSNVGVDVKSESDFAFSKKSSLIYIQLCTYHQQQWLDARPTSTGPSSPSSSPLPPPYPATSPLRWWTRRTRRRPPWRRTRWFLPCIATILQMPSMGQGQCLKRNIC